MIHQTAGPRHAVSEASHNLNLYYAFSDIKALPKQCFYVGGLWERYFIDTRYVGNLSNPYLCVDYEPLASVEKGGDCMLSAGRCYGLFTQ